MIWEHFNNCAILFSCVDIVLSIEEPMKKELREECSTFVNGRGNVVIAHLKISPFTSKILIVQLLPKKLLGNLLIVADDTNATADAILNLGGMSRQQ
ncbi:hypothetical protein TNCV_4061871 [Trichonephila clavipes]|nr:hypothetical protein TNCV_4061871 [Trichonephila clavipes]